MRHQYFFTNGFVGLPGKPNDELNLNVESFVYENVTVGSLISVVDANNPDPSSLQK